MVLISFKGPCFVHYVPSWNLIEFLKRISNYSATQIQLNTMVFSFNKMVVKVYWYNDSESNRLIVIYLLNKYLSD